LRHPIFLGVHIGQVGLALAWPSVFTAVCLVVGFAVIQIQARVEEARMAKAFGPAYAAYKRRTPAFVPRLGALPEQTSAARIWD
jgi:protein-S-isoprenylcysteine O-methyltransferase Ste14